MKFKIYTSKQAKKQFEKITRNNDFDIREDEEFCNFVITKDNKTYVCDSDTLDDITYFQRII